MNNFKVDFKIIKKYFLYIGMPASLFICILYNYILFRSFLFLTGINFYGTFILLSILLSIGAYYLDEILDN